MRRRVCCSLFERVEVAGGVVCGAPRKAGDWLSTDCELRRLFLLSDRLVFEKKTGSGSAANRRRLFGLNTQAVKAGRVDQGLIRASVLPTSSFPQPQRRWRGIQQRRARMTLPMSEFSVSCVTCHFRVRAQSFLPAAMREM